MGSSSNQAITPLKTPASSESTGKEIFANLARHISELSALIRDTFYPGYRRDASLSVNEIVIGDSQVVCERENETKKKTRNAPFFSKPA
jgi:hypothetical protein